MIVSSIEREEIALRAKAMTDDEKEIVVRFIPMQILQNEIERRNKIANDKLDMIYVSLAKSQNQSDLHNILGTLNELRGILDIGEKK